MEGGGRNEAGSRGPGRSEWEIFLLGAGKFLARSAKCLRYGVSGEEGGGLKVEGGRVLVEGGGWKVEGEMLKAEDEGRQGRFTFI